MFLNRYVRIDTYNKVSCTFDSACCFSYGSGFSGKNVSFY